MRSTSLITLLFLGVISTTEAIRLDGGEAGGEAEEASGNAENKELISLGQKLGLEVTADMFEGQSPEDVT